MILPLLFIHFIKSADSINQCYNSSLSVSSTEQKPTSFLLIKTLTSDHLADCAATCGLTWTCVSFFYHLQNRTCRLHGGKIVVLNFEEEPGWNGYDLPGRPYPEAYYPCDSSPGYQVNAGAHLCYKIHTDKKRGMQAAAVCQSEGGELVMLNTEARKTLVENIVEGDGNNEYFLGATDSAVGGQWRWMADDSLIPWFTNDETESDCFELEPDLTYDDTGCDNEEQKFICEIFL
ncbi:uncharacterized protein [Haliotis cracherodii]|uniref:uncharacterized protein n=1 Tax=Haliotis cracherodii TaxID=6455 RepID=UPI0039EAA86B